MQTFLPYPDFQESARALDNKRLGKQRVEAWQILRTISAGESAKGWRNHPAVNMWRGNEIALCAYGIAMCNEWIMRGFTDNLKGEFVEMMLNYEPITDWSQPVGVEDIQNQYAPSWLGDERIHLSHQSNLIRKDYEYYKLKFPNAPEGLAYFWITKEKINA